MQRILSTYLFVSKKLTPEFLALIHGAGFQAIELFASRGHFDYTLTQEVRGMAHILADNRLQLLSLHAPTSRDFGPNREGGIPLSITEVERVRRIEAMDELKRAIDIAENLPFSRMILHMGGPRDVADPRKRDAAFSSLEHLVLHAKHVGVTICVENTTSEMGDPAYLRTFVEETRLTGLRFNFDIGHAHLADGPEDERVATSFEAMREHIASAHIHDNLGDKDAHLPPHDGSIDWPAALKLFRSLPGGDIPLTLELKEKTGPDAQSLSDQITAAAKSLDRLEEDLQEL
ncbi:MAG TPA: sugar phosphate isomerase/epimerase family protein [Candidatus Acidoferrum sp.]|jgi:sugar phosphate isomerase/epimerase|nr:sugar phosphate isomerase/epimerase family protein [Candidatus Acidoferrum sp.]